MLLGFGDVWVALAYALTILSTVLCVVYGWARWNDDDRMPVAVHPEDEDFEFEDAV